MSVKITNKMGVYLLRNKTNGKIYIGKSVNIYERMASHKRSQKSTHRGHSIIVNAIKKYGWDNFEIEILEIYDNIDNNILLEKESIWIRKLESTNPNKGYNVLEYSSDFTGQHHTEECKQRISQIALKRYAAYTPEERADRSKKQSGINGPMYGRQHSTEAKAKMSASRMGKKHHTRGKAIKPERLKKLRQARRGRGHFHLKRPVKQIDIATGKTIQIWDSGTSAAATLTGKPNKSNGISMVCKKRKTTKEGCGICKSSLGYGWEYAAPYEITENTLKTASVI